MMGRLNHDQRQLFYSFRLEDAVPDDHLVRAIAGVLDLSWVHAELAPHYPKLGRPSIDPVLMIRMLVVGYVFAIRSERALCRDVQVNLAYRWFCGLSIEDKVPDHSAFSRARNERFRNTDVFRTVFERVVEACSKYPPAEPGALGLEPLEAAGPCCINPHSYSHCAMPPQEPSVLLGHPYLTFW
jgi:transposase